MESAETFAPEKTLIVRPASYLEPTELGALFPIDRPVEVELGAGDGSFLIHYASRCAERNFLGVERLLGRLRKVDRKGLRAGLNNLKLLRIEAGYFARYLLPKESVQALHIYFPDPWPKLKHRKYRLIDELFAFIMTRVLVPGGTIYLRTDDANYYSQMTEVFGQNTRFEPIPTPDELTFILTDFEREFHARNVRTLYAAYRLRP